MYRPLPWELLAIAPLPPLPPRPASPTTSTLPAAGEYEVDPRSSTVALTIRRLGRRDRLAGAVSGRLRVDRAVRYFALDVAATVTGPRSADVPVRLSGADLAAVDGAWLLYGAAEIDGARVWIALRLGPAERRPDGTTRLTATGTFNGRRAGLALPPGFRQVRVDIALTTRGGCRCPLPMAPGRGGEELLDAGAASSVPRP